MREWANGLVTAGYLARHPISGSYTLPPEHVPVLAEGGGLAFMGGLHQIVREMFGTIDVIEHSFRHGGGIRLADYRPRILERTRAPNGTRFRPSAGSGMGARSPGARITPARRRTRRRRRDRYRRRTDDARSSLSQGDGEWLRHPSIERRASHPCGARRRRRRPRAVRAS